MMPTAVHQRWRTLILWLLVLALGGTGTELLLLGHYEELQQWAPLATMAIGLGAALWCLFAPSASSVRFLRFAMGLLVVSALVGLWLHYQSNAEFELEMYPGREGFELFKESLMGAIPALAPGALMQLGLMGWIATFRHPALTREPSASEG